MSKTLWRLIFQILRLVYKMAARTVTAFTKYITAHTMLPRKPILETAPDQIINDQQFALEIEDVLLTDAFPALSTTSAALATLTRHRVKGRDLCGVASSENSEAYVLAWATDASDFTVALDRGAGAATLAVTANHTSKWWRGPITVNLLTGQDDIMEILTQARRDSGAGTIFVAGVAIFSAS